MKLFRSYYRRKVTQICVYIVKLTYFNETNIIFLSIFFIFLKCSKNWDKNILREIYFHIRIGGEKNK